MPTPDAPRPSVCMFRHVQDWLDIDFAVKNEVDFIAVSFVKSADVMNNLKSYVRSRSLSTIEIVAKIESFDSVPNVQARSRTCHLPLDPTSSMACHTSHQLP